MNNINIIPRADMIKNRNLTPGIEIKVSQKIRHGQAYKSHTRNRNQSLTKK